MSEIHEAKPTSEHSDVAHDLSELVRRAIIQAAELKDMEERVTEVAEKISKLTPSPDQLPETAVTALSATRRRIS